MKFSQDISGFRIFDQGALGQAHVLSHRLLDLGRYAQGHEELGEFLEGRVGQGSEWIHVQWHMLVFELAVGEWESAYGRYLQHIQPSAASDSKALTDAPAALWRLALARNSAELPWEEVRKTAIAHLDSPKGHYAELHSLLALAGAEDTAGLDRWLLSRPATSPEERTLQQFAAALRSYTAGDFGRAVEVFEEALPKLAALGGSRAQNELFVDIYRRAFEMKVDAEQTEEDPHYHAADHAPFHVASVA
jgi:hypothetical protein